MTEKEAKKKWCPFSRALEISAYSNNTASINRTDSGESHPSCMCLGDKCACWKWDIDEGFDRDDFSIYTQSKDSGSCGLVK